MTGRMPIVIGSITTIVCIAIAAAPHAASSSASAGPASPLRVRVSSRVPRFRQHLPKTPGPTTVAAARGSNVGGPANLTTESLIGGDMLPVWKFSMRSPRDGNPYVGTVIGRSPFDKPGTSKVRTEIIPLVVRTHRIATGLDLDTFNLTSKSGDTTVDPTAPDNGCMTAPNNVPIAVVRQSPVFTPTRFVVGGTDLGTTQYMDAYLRASFWNVLGSKAADYHTLLDPVHVREPIVLDVPPNEGVAITDPQFFAAFGFSICAPMQMIDFYWFDSYLRGTILPGLANVDPGSLPVFITHEGAWSYGVDNLFNCCLTGSIGLAGYPIPTQTFVTAMFDRSNFFVGPSTGRDIEMLAQEIGNWASDPYLEDNTPPWGNTPGTVGCTDGIVAGTALAGVSLPPLTAANGFGYHLQELAFFQWFFGLPAGINHWFSTGGTFLADAGSICP